MRRRADGSSLDDLRVLAHPVRLRILSLLTGAGPLAERFGEQATLLGGAVLLVLATGLVLLSRDVRALERRVSSGGPRADRSATG